MSTLLLSAFLILSTGYWLMKSTAFKALLQNRKEGRDGVREDMAQGERKHGPTAGGMYC